MIDLNSSKKNDFSLVLIAIIFIQLVVGIQGFDVCDDGFVLTFYQQIFHAPSSVEYNFVYYLSGVVGGIWYELFPKGGVLWFRFFTVIINTLKFFIAYQILKNAIPKRLAICACLMLLFINNFGFLTYYHNYLTEVLLLTSIYFFTKYLKTKNLYFILLFGAITSINVFSRITNITLFALVLSIVFYHFIKSHSFKSSFKPVLIYVLGAILGFGFILMLLLTLNHLDILKSALLSLFDLGSTEGSSHNVFSLLYIYFYDVKTILQQGIFLCILSSLFVVFYNYLSKNNYLKIALCILCFLIFVHFFKKPKIHFIYAIGLIGSLVTLFHSKYNELTRTLAFIGLLVLIVLPIGSGGGFSSSGYMCLWLSLPFYGFWLYNLGDVSFSVNSLSTHKAITIKKDSFKILTLIFCTAFLATKAYQISNASYFDPGSRLEKTYAIESKLAKGVYTKQRRATIINNVLFELNKHVQPNDYLLVFDKTPMLHFLTETRPYMYNPWVWIYDSISFKKKLQQAEKKINSYPVVVAQKFETTFYFSNPTPDYLTTDPDNTYNIDSAKTEMLFNFLDRNDYYLAWSNAYFNIYKTAKRHH